MQLPFDDVQKQEILDKLSEWEEGVFADVQKVHGSNLQNDIRFRSHVPVDLLPYDLRKEAMEKFYSIIGLSNVLQNAAGGAPLGMGKAAAQNVANMARLNGNLNWIRQLSEDQPYAQFKLEGSEGDILTHLYNSLNIQFRTPYSGQGIWSDYFRVGTKSVPRMKTIARSKERADSLPAGLLEKGKKYTIFDIETGGLDYGQIRSIDWRHGLVGVDADITTGSTAEGVNLRSSQFARGMYATSNTEAVPTEEFMRRKYGIDYRGMKFGHGSDYIEAVEPLLSRFEDSDYVIGHNISRFDIDQIFTNLAGTSRYHSDEEFRRRVDDIYEGLDSKIVDTLELARNTPELTDIATAPEFARRNQKVFHSIENILLQSNLLELHPELEDLIRTKGLHDSSVDIVVNARLAQAIMNHSLSVTNVGKIATDKGLRRIISTGGAMTPFSKITDHSLLTNQTIEHLIRTGNVQSLDPSSLLGANIEAAAQGDKRAMKVALSDIRAGVEARFNINPAQQEIITTRDFGRMTSLSNMTTDMSNALHSIGSFDRLTGRDIPYMGSVRRKFGLMNRTETGVPTEAEYRKFQQRLFDSGVPYAGLSFEERTFASGLSSLTSTLAADENAVRAADLGTESLVSHFRMWDPSMVSYTSGRPTVPIQLLQSAGVIPSNEVLATSKKPIMLRLSQYTYGDGGKDVNLGYEFVSDLERDDFISYLRQLGTDTDEEIAKAFGYDISSESSIPQGPIKKFREGLDDLIAGLGDSDRMKYGVSVGHVGAGAEGSNVFDMMDRVLGGKMRDNESVKYAVPLIDTTVASPTEAGYRGVVRTGATIETSALLPSDPEIIQRETRYSASYLDDIINNQIVRSGSVYNTAKLIKSAGTSNDVVNRILRVHELYDTKIKANFPAIALGLAASVVGYLGVKRHQEDKEYSQPLQQMPYESEAGSEYMLKYNVMDRLLSGQGSYSRKIDPLATAPLVGNMRDYAIGHSSTSWDKNSAIYGGLI